MPNTRFILFLAALLLCGCTTVSTRQYRAAQEQKILEAVLLQQLAHPDTNRLVFIAVQDPAGNCIDPPDALISSLRAVGIPARNLSESTRDELTTVIDKATGKPGAIYYAGVLRWRSNSKVEVIMGTISASFGGGFTEFVMEKREGRWVRTKTKRMVTT